MGSRQPRPQLRVADREQLEFHHEHGPATIADARNKKFTDGSSPRRGCAFARDDLVDAVHAPLRFLLQQREEKVILGSEMRIKRAAGVPYGGGNIFDTAGFEAVARKDAAGRLQQGTPRGFGAPLMFGGGPHGTAARLFPRSDGGCLEYHVLTLYTFMHVYN